MTVGKYAPRCFVHPSRYGFVKSDPDDLWFVLHTSEGSESTNSAEALCSFMGSQATASNVASYHVVFDTDIIRPAVPYDRVAYSAGGGNARGRHGCFPGKAGQTRAQWLDTNSRNMIRQAAAWLVDQGVGWLYSKERLTVAQVQASNVHGVCDHHDISRAFRKSNHWDVGPEFPWDVLYADIAYFVSQQGVTMTTSSAWQQAPIADVIVRPGALNIVRVPQAAGKKAATVTLTAVTPGSGGFVIAFLGTRPNGARSLSYNPGLVESNTVTVPVDADGWFGLDSTSDVRVLVDLVGVHS